MEPLAADVERDLRRALTLIADDAISAAANQAERHRTRRGLSALWVGRVRSVAAATATVVTLAGGAFAMRMFDEGPAASGESISTAEMIACARMIAVGNVLDVQAAPEAGRQLVTFEVTRWIKATTGDDVIERHGDVVTLDVVDVRPYSLPRDTWQVGGPILVVVPGRREEPTGFLRGEFITTELNAILHWLPRASTTLCPPGWGIGDPPPPPGGQDW